MDGSIWKDLLDRLGCLDNGRFAAPRDFREVSIIVRTYGCNRAIMLRRDKPAPEEWSYTDEFLIYDDQKGHTTYHAWYGVESVNTNEA